MMSLFTGIRLNQKLAGIIALSGVLPETVDTMKTDLQIKQKVLMVHGSEDKIVPVINVKDIQNDNLRL